MSRHLRRRYGHTAYPRHNPPDAQTRRTPEYALLKRWAKARRSRTLRHSKIDSLQYELQSMSDLGWRMVWGSEWAKERGDR